MSAHRIPKTDYSSVATYYDKVRPTPVDIMLDRIIKYGGINNGSYVLDIGCGTGDTQPTCLHAHSFSALWNPPSTCSNKP